MNPICQNIPVICLHLEDTTNKLPISPTYFKAAILPVATKDLSISPRFSPTIFYRDASSALFYSPVVQLVTSKPPDVGTRVKISVQSHELGFFLTHTKKKAQQVENDLHKIRLHGRRGKGTAESFSREKLRQTPQKKGGEILCDLLPV